MDAEKIIQDLSRRFAAPLPEFYKRRVIFWYDEDREFEDQIDEISLEGVKIAKLTGSNSFAVKKLLAADDTESNYLVYCPLSYEHAEDNWLLNIEMYSGEPFRADLNTIWMDEMGLPASQALRSQVKQYHKFFNSKDRRAKIAAMAGSIRTSAQMHLAVMAAVCGVKGPDPGGIIRAVLKGGLEAESNAVYREIVNFGAQAPFWALIAQATGYKVSEEPNLGQLAAHILLTAATRTLRREYLSGLDDFISPSHQSFCYDLVSDWMHSPDLHDLYTAARKVEAETRLAQRFDKLSIEDLRDTECFPCVNEVILTKMMTEINDRIIRSDEIVQTVEKRRTMVWYDYMSDYYEALLQVAKMQTFLLEHSAGFHTAKPKDIWKEYTADYYRMDSFYRAFHICYQRALRSSGDLLEGLKHVVDRVEEMYSNRYLNDLAANWSNVAAEDLEKYGYIEDISRQTHFYANDIRPCDSRVFVIISDALRYETAASLAEQLRRETQSKVTLDSMCGIFPTITPYGMAALLPHRELSVQPRPTGALAVLADGQSTDSPNREKVLKAANPASTALQYRNIIGLKRADRQALVKGMNVVYIYHDKIDETAHTSDTSVFQACDEAIEEIKNLVRIIVNEFGSTHILITADHGFLYTFKPLTEDAKVSKESWDGKEADYGRRYAIMAKDAQPEYLMPVRFLDGKTDYGAFAPRENIRIKMSGGGANFVHGGISLQEMVVPRIDYHYLRSDSKEYLRNRALIDTKPVEIGLLSANRRIGNMIFSLNFYQKEAVGDNREKADYSLYFTDSSGKIVSDTARIIADKTSADARERTFRCTFNLKSLSFDSKETYYLVIADDSGLQAPQKAEFHIDIAFAVDEFNFF